MDFQNYTIRFVFCNLVANLANFKLFTLNPKQIKFMLQYALNFYANLIANKGIFMDSVLQTLGESLGVWGYIILFFYSLGGGFVALLAAGIISSIESSSLNIALCIFVAGSANLIGSSALFYLSRYQKNEVMRFLRNHRRKIALSHIWIKKFDYFIIFIHKYLYGIKTIVPMVIGFSKYSGKKFVFYNFFASFLWAIIIGVLSYAMGETIRYVYEKYSNSYIFYAIGICIIVALVFIANRVTKSVKK